MFEDLFEKARQTMTTDKAAEDCGLTKDTKVRLSQIKDLGCVKDAKMQIGAISHRKDGDYRKVAEGKFVPVKMPGKGGAETSKKERDAAQHNNTVKAMTMKNLLDAYKRGDLTEAGFKERAKQLYEGGSAEKTSEKKPAAKKETKAARPASNKSVNMGLNKQAALAFAKKSGDTAFLMKNKDGEYAVANSAAEFDAAEKAGYEAANEELHPHNQVSAVRRDSATPKGVMSELSRGFYNSKHPEDFERDMADMGYETLEFNDEYAVVQNNKGSQFQVKFSDHGDGRDFGAESINLTYQDEDDDTDYDELD